MQNGKYNSCWENIVLLSKDKKCNKNDQMSIFYQEKKREEKKIVLSSPPAEATIVRPSEKEEVIINT